MKSVFAAILFFTSIALAQNVPVETAQTAKRETISSHGFRISVFKPVWESRFEIIDEAGFGSSLYNYNYTNSVGASLGYAFLPANFLGWTANISYIGNDSESFVKSTSRADFNVAYTFSTWVNFKAGVNISKIEFAKAQGPLMSSKDEDNATTLNQLPPAIGYQGGIGLQLNRYIGLDISAVTMGQAGTIDNKKISLRQSGYEIGLNGTF